MALNVGYHDFPAQFFYYLTIYPVDNDTNVRVFFLFLYAFQEWMQITWSILESFVIIAQMHHCFHKLR